MAFKILSIDGGGTKGIIPARILQRIEEDWGIPAISYFNLIAGTSTGGIISLGLGAGMSGHMLVDLYLTQASTIFKESWSDRQSKLDEQFRANYRNTHFRALLEHYFGELTLGHLHRDPQIGGAEKEIMVCTFDLNPEAGADRNQNYRPAIFHSSFLHQKEERLVDLVLRTTAAPTYFPIVEKKYIDGGVAMNNPAMAAIAYAMNDTTVSENEQGMYLANGYKGLRQLRNDIYVLSLGTGSSHNNRIPAEKIKHGDWGNLQWIKYLPQLIIESNVQSSIYYARHVLPEGHFFRIDPIFDEFSDEFSVLHGKAIPMDTSDPVLLNTMVALADRVYVTNREAIHAFLFEIS